MRNRNLSSVHICTRVRDELSVTSVAGSASGSPGDSCEPRKLNQAARGQAQVIECNTETMPRERKLLNDTAGIEVRGSK